MGSRAAVALYIMSGKQAKEAVVAGSVTKAIEMGSNHQGTLLASGMIGDVNHKVDGGFLLGTTILHTNKGDYELDYQNEFLRVRLGKRPVVLTPDIITLIEQIQGIPSLLLTCNMVCGSICLFLKRRLFGRRQWEWLLQVLKFLAMRRKNENWNRYWRNKHRCCFG